MYTAFIRAFQLETRLMRVNQNSKKLWAINQNNELKDAKTLHRAEGNCRVWW